MKEKGKERGNVRSLCYQTHACWFCIGNDL